MVLKDASRLLIDKSNSKIVGTRRGWRVQKVTLQKKERNLALTTPAWGCCLGSRVRWETGRVGN